MPENGGMNSGNIQQGSLPFLAPYPPPTLQSQLTSTQWNAYLTTSVAVADRYLQSDSSNFASAVKHESGLSKFLQSYYASSYGLPKQHASLMTTDAQRLRQQTFLLVHRIITEGLGASSGLVQWQFLSQLSHGHSKTQRLSILLQAVWTKHEQHLRKSLGQARSQLMKALESTAPAQAREDLSLVAPLLHSLPQAAAFMAEGSEFIDALATAYNADASLKDALVPVAYLSLAALTRPETANRTALIDHLYSLKAQAEASSGHSSLLADLVTNTPLLGKLAGNAGEKGAERARTLAASLKSFETPSIARHRKQRVDKGKAPAGHDTGEHHVHRLSKITQIQDLFPDLGAGFVARLLDAFDEDVELVTAHLLEDSLPPHLASLDRAMPLASNHTPDPASQAAIDTLIPNSHPPSSIPQRRNVFDNDDFDRLAISSSQFHTGHSSATDKILSTPRTAEQKASILSALAAFDPADDERDDTYDAADIGAADAGSDTESADPIAAHEPALFQAWTANPALFARDAATRRAQPRQQLKRETGLSDEALEGWATMLSRDRRRQDALARRAADEADSVGQTQLARTAWRAPSDDEESGGDAARGRGGFRGRGRGRGRGGAVGAAGEGDSARARQRKEANKSRGANHSRREGRARKVARAGFA